MDLLSYQLTDLGDTAQRGALFADLIDQRQGLSADALPAFLAAVDSALSSAEDAAQEHESLLDDLRAALARIETTDPEISSARDNLADLLDPPKEPTP